MSLIQVIPLGGAGEIGKNCTVLRFGDEMILVDCGLSFPHEEHYGVDIVVPDFTYLRENKDKLKAVFITHAHEDHVGALSFFVQEFKTPIYCTPLAEAMVRAKLEERVRMVDIPIKRMAPGQRFKVGQFDVEPIQLTHSIPEMCALAFHTEGGAILFTGDFKFDSNPVDGIKADTKRLAELGEEGVLLLVSESTNIDRPGWGPSESEVTEGYLKIFKEAPGRIMVTMFSSNIHRMQQAVDAAKATGRRVAVAGRRMDETVRMCQRLKYLNIPDNIYTPIEEIGKYSANQIVVLVTGSQGEPMAALSQMSRGEYSRLRLVKGDTVLYSARPIPGNEGGIWRTVNRLIKMGADVITESETPIHVSGHAYHDELEHMVKLTKPFYVCPVHGEPRHQKAYSRMLVKLGHAEHRMFTLANGMTLNIDETHAWIGDTVHHGDILIDQHGNVPVTDEVLSQRVSLALDGIVVVSLAVDLKSGVMLSRPEAQARGFSGPGSAIEDALDALCDELGRLEPNDLRSRNSLETTITDIMKRVIFRHCQQRPVIMPVLAESRK